MEKGLLVILSGVSSVGKGGIRERLKADPELNLHRSVSITTRPAKEGEVDGENYYFVSFESFADAIKNKELVEYTEFNGYYYGTPKAQLDFLLNQGKNVLVEVEAQGVGALKLNYPDSIAFYVVPSSIEELEHQIISRYGDHDASVKSRVNKAKLDMQMADLFRNTVSNEDADAAEAYIKDMIFAELNKRKENK